METEYQDPFTESGQRGLEKLMAIGVLTEAGSRLAAERARNRATVEERQLERERAGDVAERKAQRLARAEESRRTREFRTLAADPTRLREHLGGLPVQEVARHWRWGADGTAGDRGAATVMAASERELRRRWPALMNAYDQARQDGADAHQAMDAAARRAFFGGARPHGSSVHAPGGKLPVLDNELDKHFRRSAGHLDPISRRRWLNALEERGWSPESLAWAETLLQRAETERGDAAAAAAVADDLDTVRDERADGLEAAGVATARTAQFTAGSGGVVGVAGRTSAAPGHGSGRVDGKPPPARLARLSFAAPIAAGLRPAVPPPASGAPSPDRLSKRGLAR